MTAISLGWRIKVRCRRGREDEERRKSSRECDNWRELDVETLVASRGRDFPFSVSGTLPYPRGCFLNSAPFVQFAGLGVLVSASEDLEVPQFEFGTALTTFLLGSGLPYGRPHTGEC
jgi:hypothetical protein